MDTIIDNILTILSIIILTTLNYNWVYECFRPRTLTEKIYYYFGDVIKMLKIAIISTLIYGTIWYIICNLIFKNLKEIFGFFGVYMPFILDQFL